MDSCTHCRSNNLHSGVIIIVLLTAVYITFNGKLTATMCACVCVCVCVCMCVCVCVCVCVYYL